jgi:hypothetical protein
MKSGTFFQIPETPGDVDALRASAAPLDESTLPRWLQEGDRACYRYVGKSSFTGLSLDRAKRLQFEIAQLETAGLVVEPDPHNANLRHVYIPAAPDYDTWSIGVYTGASLTNLVSPSGVANPVLTRDDIRDSPAVFVADPFVLRQDGAWFMFFEILNWHANKGEIGLATSMDGLHWQYQERVLVEPFHLSYPYVFEHDGQHYMMPEARQSGALRLYCASEFPVRWSFVATMIDTNDLVDASVLFANGRWWLLAGCTTRANHDTLRLFFADAITGPWSEHPASPVVCGNPHTARPAGRIILADSRIYRFGQNCHPMYGTDVRAFEITELTTSRYQERVISPNPILGPSGGAWNACGMHHIDAHQLAHGMWFAFVDGWTTTTSKVRPRG